VKEMRRGVATGIGHIDAPWARDASGHAVVTHYSLDGGDLVQRIRFSNDTVFPVVADPKYTWGIATGTVYYDRGETRSLKTQAYAETVAAGICAFFGPETAGAACVLSGAVMLQWSYVAGNAYGDGKCVKIKAPTFWAYAYSGGYCR
jgi:hypothetical protein